MHYTSFYWALFVAVLKGVGKGFFDSINPSFANFISIDGVIDDVHQSINVDVLATLEAVGVVLEGGISVLVGLGAGQVGHGTMLNKK